MCSHHFTVTVEQKMANVPMEKRPRCAKGMQHSHAESSQDSHAGNIPLWNRLLFWGAQATAAESQETLQPERAGEGAPGLPSVPEP